MIHINLKSPILREKELSYTEFNYPIISKTFLPEPNIQSSHSFCEVLNKRRSQRNFRLLNREYLNSLLWFSARTIETTSTNIRWEHRPAPSAGGRHPIDIFVLDINKETTAVYLYQNAFHSLAELQLDKSKVSQLIVKAEEIIPRSQATIIWLGAQFERTTSRYEYGESLVWKDAGALTSTIALVAESLELNCCPLGITGEPYFSKAFNTNQIVGVGGIYVGNR